MDDRRKRELLAAYRIRVDRFARVAAARRPTSSAIAAPAEERPSTLSARELEILRLVADGLTSKEIARKLYVAEETVRSHVAHSLARLGARNRAHAVAIAARRGILPVSDAMA